MHLQVWSQTKAAQAQAKQWWNGEMIPIEVPAGRKGTILVEHDEFPKP